MPNGVGFSFFFPAMSDDLAVLTYYICMLGVMMTLDVCAE